jgi:hypothetical protein
MMLAISLIYPVSEVLRRFLANNRSFSLNCYGAFLLRHGSIYHTPLLESDPIQH